MALSRNSKPLSAWPADAVQPPKAFPPAEKVAGILGRNYPPTSLGNKEDPMDELIFIILSGQTNDPIYRWTFERLRRRYPRWDALADATSKEIASAIGPGGLSKQKARYISAIARRLRSEFGAVDLNFLRNLSDLEAEEFLLTLPGVGKKSARCVIMYSLGRQVFPLDTHCRRIMTRLGWLPAGRERLENLADLAQSIVPSRLRREMHILLVQHGRAVCTSDPRCQICPLSACCPSAKHRRAVDRDPKPIAKPRFVDLCCGAGGFSSGFKAAGWQPLLGVDVSADRLATYERNMRTPTLHMDIRNRRAAASIISAVDGERINAVIAGPPCQSFSVAGHRDPNDRRNQVFLKCVRVAVSLSPDLIVLENVKNLTSSAYRRILARAVGILTKSGYSVRYGIFDAASFGVAQRRKRLLLVAVIANHHKNLERAFAKLGSIEFRTPSVKQALRGLPAGPGSRGWGAYENHEPMDHTTGVVRKILAIAPGGGPLSYRKLDPDKPAGTLVCGHRAFPCHYRVPRTITVREAARIQSFPDTFIFRGSHSSQMQQVADAVPPRMGKVVGEICMEHLAPVD